jgi:hypothetical protein
MKVEKSNLIFFAIKKKLSCPVGGWAAELERLEDQTKQNPTV